MPATVCSAQELPLSESDVPKVSGWPIFKNNVSCAVAAEDEQPIPRHSLKTVFATSSACWAATHAKTRRYLASDVTKDTISAAQVSARSVRLKQGNQKIFLSRLRVQRTEPQNARLAMLAATAAKVLLKQTV